ncbi:MAG: potassium channel family protein [Casimicrobiaceae bacterium]
MAIRSARDALGRVFFQRCFYLFVLLLVLIAGMPFVEPTAHGRLLINLVGASVVVSTVAAVGRSMFSFVIVLVLAGLALYFQFVGVTEESADHLAFSWAFGAALYALTIGYLLRYVFQPQVMTVDKLYGAAAAYLMLGVLWASLYALVEYRYPGSFALGGTVTSFNWFDFLYFSFTVLSSTGFGDITAVTRQARSVCVVEQLVGVLFIAILIARLAGVYPPTEREGS